MVCVNAHKNKILRRMAPLGELHFTEAYIGKTFKAPVLLN